MTDFTKSPEPESSGPAANEHVSDPRPDHTPEPLGSAHFSHDHGGGRQALWRLLAIVAIVVFGALITGMTNTVLVLLAVIAMVMIHEFGHFLTAKAFGMKVTEYFLGFGPRIWSFRRGETEYGVKAIPAGGYVRIVGMSNLEDIAAQEESRTYRAKPFWQKVIVTGAGSFMHFVMAFLLLFALFGVFGVPKANTTIRALSDLSSGPSPAAAAGLQPGDKILVMGETPIDNWTQLQTFVSEHGGQTVPVRIERNGSAQSLSVTLGSREGVKLADGSSLGGTGGFLGASPQTPNTRMGPIAAVSTAASGIYDNTKIVISTIGQRFSPSGLESIYHQVVDARSNGQARAAAEAQNLPAPVTETDQDQARLVSPLGLANISHQAAEAGIRQVLLFLFSINLFVGIFNLIPLLPFDGGHIAVATYERLRSFGGKRHRVDFAKLIPVSYAVLLVLVLMGLSSLWIDAWYPQQNIFQ